MFKKLFHRQSKVRKAYLAKVQVGAIQVQFTLAVLTSRTDNPYVILHPFVLDEDDIYHPFGDLFLQPGDRLELTYHSHDHTGGCCPDTGGEDKPVAIPLSKEEADDLGFFHMADGEL